MRDGLEAKMVRRVVACTRTQERTDGAQNRPTRKGCRSREDRHESARGEEAGGLHASFESSTGAVAFKYSLGPFCLQRSYHVTFLYR